MYIKVLSDLAGLDLAEGEANAGGLVRLRLMPVNQIDQILFPSWRPRPEDPSATVPLQISGQSLILIDDHLPFVDLPVMPEYASYSENQLAEKNGEFYRPIIQILIPKDRPGVAAWCHRYRAVRWVALIQDRNGLIRLVGTHRQPLRMAVENNTGAGKNGKNVRTLTFSAQVERPALFVEAIDDLNLFPDSPFSSAFGFAFQS